MSINKTSLTTHHKKISGKRYYLSIIFAILLPAQPPCFGEKTAAIRLDIQRVLHRQQYEGFDTKNFLIDMDSIQQKTSRILQKVYHTDNITVDIAHISRSLAEQKQYLKQGTTLTLASLHLFNAACDFRITINGKMVTGTSRGRNKGNIDPFRYLGGVALQHGYFWGRKGDCGHVGATESLAQFIRQHPEIIHSAVFQELLVEIDTSPTSIQYKDLLEVYDSIIGTTKQRVYTGSLKTWGGRLDPLYHEQ